MKWHLCLVIYIFSLSLSAVASEEPDIVKNPPLVEVHQIEDTLVPYRERRSDHGFMFSVNQESFVPKNYLSTLDNAIYTDIWGESPIQVVGIELGYKYNFPMGSLGFGIGYGTGRLSGTLDGLKRTIDVQRPFASVTYIMDALFEEPYVAPYGELKFWQMTIKETSPSDSFSANTGLGFTYSTGILIQLNQLDPSTAEVSTHNFGLENTYLDIYMAKYTQTQNADDADTETDFTFGAGLRLEF